jgi:hypothetical protein
VRKGRQKFPGNNGLIEIGTHQIIGRDNHSHVKVEWITKMQKKIYIHHSHTAIEELYAKIKYYNDICEMDRNFEGHDDEPEDEISLLK